MKHNDQMKENKTQVRDVILRTVKTQKLLSAGIVITVVGAIIAALIPPLILAEIVDTITEGNGAPLFLILSYFGMIVITGMTESAREGLLTVFGQKITHALRSSMMKKFISLTADNINRQEPGTVVSRFVGDVDTVENLFSSGIISMFADACKILSILFVIWFENRGLTLVLLILLPFFVLVFTRHVQKNMLRHRLRTEKQWEERPVMCRKRFIISGRFTALEKKIIWKSVMINISVKVTGRWKERISMMRYILR